jgi:hypothetical protein
MMKRLLACLLSVTVVLVGCGRSYKLRLENTVTTLKYLARLDHYLNPAVQGKFKDMQVFLRPPKPLQETEQLGLQGVGEGQFDLSASFLGQEKAAGGAEPGKEATPAGDAVLRLHVLARVKLPKRKTKKGEAAPPEPAARGEFTADVRSVLASDYNAGDAAATGQLKSDSHRKNTFKRLIFTSPVNNDVVRVFFYKHGNHDVALIWDIPPALEKTTATGINLCLESFAVGEKANRFFARGYHEDEGLGGGPIPGKGGGAEGGGGVAF